MRKPIKIAYILFNTKRAWGALIFTFASFVGLSIYSNAQVNNNNNPVSNLIGWWPLDEITEGHVADLTQNQLAGIPHQVQPTTNTPSGGALYFSNYSYVDFGNNPPIDLSQGFTISIWIKGSRTTEKTIVAHWEGNDSNVWNLEISKEGLPQLQFLNGKTNTQTFIFSQNTPSILDGNFHHVVGVYDRIQSKASIYVDDLPESSQDILDWSLSSIQSFTLGAGTASQPNPPFILDEVQLYKTPLSTIQVHQLFKNYTKLWNLNTPQASSSASSKLSSSSLTETNQIQKIFQSTQVGFLKDEKTTLGMGVLANPSSATERVAITNQYETILLGLDSFNGTVTSNPFPSPPKPTRVLLLTSDYHFDDRGSLGSVLSDGCPDSNTRCGIFNHCILSNTAGGREIPISDVSTNANNQLELLVNVENNLCVGGPLGYFLTIVWEAEISKPQIIFKKELENPLVTNFIKKGTTVKNRKIELNSNIITISAPPKADVNVDSFTSTRGPIDNFKPQKGTTNTDGKFQNVLTTEEKTPTLKVEAMVGGIKAISDDHDMLPALYQNDFKCTIYYTPIESGFTKAGGFNVTLETRNGLQNRKYPHDFLRSVQTEGFGRIKTSVDGKSFIRFDKSQNPNWGFANKPIGNRENELIPKQSCAVDPTKIPTTAQITTLSDTILNVFGNQEWNVADIGEEIKQMRIDLYWGEDNPRGVKGDIFRPASTTFTENDNTIIILKSY